MLAILQYTSGSTAAPRGVDAEPREPAAQHAPDRASLRDRREASRGVIWLPPFHDMGLIGGILQGVHGGFPIALMSPVAFLRRPARWLEAITRYRATISGGPNFAYDLCVDRITPAERGWTGPVDVGGRIQWRRAGPRGDSEALRRHVRAVRLPSRQRSTRATGWPRQRLWSVADNGPRPRVC